MLSRLSFYKKTDKVVADANTSRGGPSITMDGSVHKASQAQPTLGELHPPQSESRAKPADTTAPSRAGAVAARGEALAEFAQRLGLSESEVWRRLRNGELLARSERGQIMILDDNRLEPAGSVLPPLPGEALAPPQAMALTGATAASSEVALLLDHLSLAKEENREILKMTQDAIRRVTELTDSIVTMKNAVIEAKDSQIVALREQLAAREERIAQLLQKQEDLEMLARALTEKS